MGRELDTEIRIWCFKTNQEEPPKLLIKIMKIK